MHAWVVCGVDVFAKFQSDFPAVSIIVMAGVMASLYPMFEAVFPKRVLPTLSGTGFLFAASVNAFVVFNALYAERMVRSDPPLWRTRVAVANGVHWFMAMVVLVGVPLPSTEAAIWFGTALVYGAFMARLTEHSKMVFESGMFDLERPLWATPVGERITTWSAFAVAGVAGLVTVFSPQTAVGLFAVIIVIPFMLPFGLKNLTRWRERELVTLLAFAGLMVGLFAAG